METFFISAKYPEYLIEYIKLTLVPDLEGEKHHIVPNSWVRNKEIVVLSRERHKEAHRLLALASIQGIKGQKMVMAYEMMSRTKSFKGREFSAEHRKRMSDSAKSRPKRTLSVEHKNKLSHSKKGRKPKGGRPRVEYLFLYGGQEYLVTLQEMCEISGSSFSNLNKVVKGKRNISKGVTCLTPTIFNR